MNRCPSCGGIIGKDCFNPVECAAISERMAQYHDMNHYDLGHVAGYQDSQNEIEDLKQQIEMWKERALEAEKKLKNPTPDYNDVENFNP